MRTLIAALIALSTLALSSSPSRAASPADNEVRVFRVVDGDTLVLVNDDHIRLRGINTPEVGEASADAATAFARTFCEGRTARLETGTDTAGNPLPARKDHYGRLLADVIVDGKSLSEALVREGHAHVFVIPPPPLADYERLVRIQAEARTRKKGIWSTPRFQGKLHITSFHANAPGDDRTNLAGEYLRIANISTEPLQLEGYTLSNHRRMTFRFPAAILPAGYTVMVFTGKGKNELDPEAGPLKVYWNLDEPAWTNTGDTATVRSPQGAVQDEVEYTPKPGPWGKRRRR